MSDLIGLEVLRGQVLGEWIDINDHMNVAYFVLAFDQAVDCLWERFGITNEHIEQHGSSTFAVESHITWQREISEAEPYIITSQVLAYDEKRIHQFMRMYHANNKTLCATAEWMNLHIDITLRRVAPWPPHILEAIASYVAAQDKWPWPEEACERIRVPNPVFSAAGGDAA